MAGRRSAHIEPFKGADLTDYLVKKHGAKLDRVTGSHFIFHLPNGDVIGSVKNDSPVAKVHARDVAFRLGMTYREFREDIGHPIVNAGKSATKPTAKVTKRVVTRSQLLRLVQDVRAELDIAQRAMSGDRDSSVYESAFGDLQHAATSVRRAAETLTRVGRREVSS